MTPTNVVSMDFETKEAMEDFLETYERDSPTLYPDAEMLLMIKTTETVSYTHLTLPTILRV